MEIKNFPEVRQTYEYDCGAKALQAVLQYYGIDLSEEKIMRISGTNQKTGTSISGIIKVLNKNKLKQDARQFTLKEIKRYINKKIPVILILQAWTSKKKINWEKDLSDGHYVIAIGYDKEKIYFEDPYSIFRTYLTFKELYKRWHSKKNGKKQFVHYGIAVHGKRPSFNLKKKIHMD